MTAIRDLPKRWKTTEERNEGEKREYKDPYDDLSK